MNWLNVPGIINSLTAQFYSGAAPMVRWHRDDRREAKKETGWPSFLALLSLSGQGSWLTSQTCLCPHLEPSASAFNKDSQCGSVSKWWVSGRLQVLYGTLQSFIYRQTSMPDPENTPPLQWLSEIKNKGKCFSPYRAKGSSVRGIALEWLSACQLYLFCSISIFPSSCTDFQPRFLFPLPTLGPSCVSNSVFYF